MTTTHPPSRVTPDTPAAGAAPYAVPRVAPQRRRRPGWIAAGVAMIAVGGLISWQVITTVGSSAEYLAVARPVPVGAVVTREDLAVVRISVDPQLNPIPAAEVQTVIGKHAAVELVPRNLLTPTQLTDRAAPGPGQQLVGLSLSPEQAPTKRLKPGAPVLLIITGDDAAPTGDGQSAAPPTKIAASVVDVRRGDTPGGGDGAVYVNVAVSEGDGPLVAARGAAGRVVLVLTSGG